MAKVKAADLEGRDLDACVAEVFEPFGGGRALLKKSGNVYIKVNAIDFKPNVHTDPALIGAVIRYFRRQGARNVYVIENSTQGNFTRLVFHITGISRVCRNERAHAVCLDETGAVPIRLPNMGYTIDISQLVYEKLILGREENLYINIPALKTHSMTGVTLGIKNQFGLVHQASRIADHNYRLHRKLADIYHVIRPDFTLIDAQKATNHGHYTAEKFAGECIVPMNLLIGGADTLAVDAVGSHLMGFSVDEVEHLRLVREDGLGCGELSEIEIIGRGLIERRRRKLTHQLLDHFPAGVAIFRGRERCCDEGCRRNTETALEVFANDVGCLYPFSIIMGKGASPEEAASIEGPVLLAGDCAIEDHAATLKKRLGPGRVFMSSGCNDLAATCGALMSLMGISAMKVARCNPAVAVALLAVSKIRGSRARVTRILPSRVRR